jgi:hypothetical protein
MREILFIPAMAALLLAAPAAARQAAPIGDRDPNAVDIAKTPVTDLNIDKQQIPELLILAQQKPYDIEGLEHCSQLSEAVVQFDEVLGADLDLPQEARDRIDAGRIGKAVVNSFIPFRGVIREVSGASEHQRMVRAAIQAGLARRGFLKGVGEARGCSYPARSATREVVAQHLADRQTAEEKKAGGSNGTSHASDAPQPIEQATE